MHTMPVLMKPTISSEGKGSLLNVSIHLNMGVLIQLSLETERDAALSIVSWPS
jgi:hypothetical protein